MGPGLTILIAFVAAVVLIGLALWVWRQGQANVEISVEPSFASEAAIEVPSALDPTQFTPYESVARVIVDERTQSLPPPVSFDEATQSLPPPAALEEATQTLPKPFATETLSREEIDAVIAQHRAQQQPAAPEQPEAPKREPAQTQILPRSPLPARTEVLPRPAAEPAHTEVLPKHTFDQPIEPPMPQPAAKPIEPAKPLLPHTEPSARVSEPPPPKEFELRRAPPPSIAPEVLTEHFESAQRAFAPMLGEDELDAKIRGPEREWKQHVEVLALTAERSVNELAWPTLIDASASASRRKAAALVLLELEAAKGHERLLERFNDLDQVGREAAILALTLWTNPRAEATTLKGWQAATELDQQLLWLRVFVDRAADPGPAVITKLLDSTQPELLAIGLGLLPVHAEGRQHAARLDRYILTGKPPVRMAAVRAGLAFERPAPWLACKQASRDPALPEICLLYAMLAPVKDLDTLSGWAKQSAAPAHAGWALGASGRRVGIEVCLERLDHADANVAGQALTGFRHATGYKGSKAATAAREWWKAKATGFDPDKRYLGGELLTLGSARRGWGKTSRESRDALRLELLVRSGGRVRLPALALPSREHELLAELDGVEIDLNRAWGSPK